MGTFVLLGIIVVIILFFFIHNKIENNILEKERIKKVEEQERQEKWKKEQLAIKEQLLQEIHGNLLEGTTAFKWIAPIIADIMIVLRERGRNSTELISSRRSDSTSARVDVLIKEQKDLIAQNKILEYQMEYIRTLIPEVEDLIDFEESKDENTDVDKPSNFLTKEEYISLSETEKNKRALNYYKHRKKYNWEIGRDFEMYIGYLFENENYDVEYFGIEKKFNDLGRDLIIRKSGMTKVVQCKYWSKEKTIHEKHIAQLYGTLAKYKFDNHNENVTGLFVTHTVLSNTAREFANTLKIEIIENVELGEYPLIKCDNRQDEFGQKTKIYHLPMDQQYNIVQIDKKRGDCYALTIEEAERMGYRRAYKWHGNA
jgi:hypothetical protein